MDLVVTLNSKSGLRNKLWSKSLMNFNNNNNQERLVSVMLSAIEERVRVLCPFQHDHIISYIASERAPGIIHTLPYLSLRYLFLLLLLILLLHIPYPSTSLPLPLLPSLLHLSSCTPLSSSPFSHGLFPFFRYLHRLHLLWVSFCNHHIFPSSKLRVARHCDPVQVRSANTRSPSLSQ